MLKIIVLDNKKIRVVGGKLLNELSLDWTMPLNELKRVIEFAVFEYKDDLSALKTQTYKKLVVYQGSNHLDLVDDGLGSLGLLYVADHPEPE